jgi:hypothetical protein
MQPELAADMAEALSSFLQLRQLIGQWQLFVKGVEPLLCGMQLPAFGVPDDAGSAGVAAMPVSCASSNGGQDLMSTTVT